MRHCLPLLVAALLLAACSSNKGTGTSAGNLEVACPTDQTNCGTACALLTSDSQNCGACGAACDAGQACVMGVCATVCPQGSLLCGSICVEPRSDDLNCGTCGHVCGAGTDCVDGGCDPACGLGLTTCLIADGGIDCVDVTSDQSNCGACGNVCHGSTCVDGGCGSTTSCAVGLTTCALSDGGIDCADVTSESANCGACGHDCPTGETCQDSQCQLSCLVTQLACGGQCVNPGTDSQNCGGCAGDGGVVCPAGQVCNGFGVCLATCGSPLAFCPGLRPATDGGNADAGYCADLGNDFSNCGTCGNGCPSGDACLASQCELTCLATELSCGGQCVDPNTDSNNCGGCVGDGGVACPAGEICNGFGQCISSCGSPLAFCPGLRPAGDGGARVGNPDAGYCADLGNDPLDCGACGKACQTGSYCLDGQCQLNCPASGQSCLTPQTLASGGTFTGNSCCGSAFALDDGGCISSPEAPMVAFQLPPATFLDSYVFQMTNGFVGSYTPEICLSQAALTDLTCTSDGASSFPASGGTDYLAVGQLDGGCGPFSLTVTVSSGL